MPIVSKTTLLRTFTHPRTGTTFSLLHVSAGLEPAGSGTRYTKEVYRVAYALRDGTKGSRAYVVRHDAEADYEHVLAKALPPMQQVDEVRPAN